MECSESSRWSGHGSGRSCLKHVKISGLFHWCCLIRESLRITYYDIISEPLKWELPMSFYFAPPFGLCFSHCPLMFLVAEDWWDWRLLPHPLSLKLTVHHYIVPPTMHCEPAQTLLLYGLHIIPGHGSYVNGVSEVELTLEVWCRDDGIQSSQHKRMQGSCSWISWRALGPWVGSRR